MRQCTQLSLFRDLNFLIKKRRFLSSIFVIYIEILIYFIQKITLKEVINKVFNLNSKYLKSFNKKQVNKNINSMIKEESIDLKINEYKYEQLFAELYFQKLN